MEAGPNTQRTDNPLVQNEEEESSESYYDEQTDGISKRTHTHDDVNKAVDKRASENIENTIEPIKLEDIKSFDNGFRSKFAPYREIINSLTKRQNIETELDIIYCCVSNDSSTILLVLMQDDEKYVIQQYDTDTLTLRFNKELSGVYIKAKEII
jgi:hypothetical protein